MVDLDVNFFFNPCSVVLKGALNCPWRAFNDIHGFALNEIK
jgi:hypothetical protein